MFYPRQLFRLYNIHRIFVRHGFDQLLPFVRHYPLLRVLLWITPDYWQRDLSLSRGEHLRLALESLGPIFIKFGQILSTRRDLLPDDIAESLARLQDKVQPFPTEQVYDILQTTYQKPLSQVFAQFDHHALAAASIAQVHAAVLHDGRKVVVKIVRPNILLKIQKDINVLYMFANLLQRYWSEGKRLHPVEVVAEFEKALHDELDLMREAGNCAILKRNFTDSPLLYVPEVIWEYTRQKVMVMERIHGIPVRDMAALKKHGINFKALAENGVETFFTQVFKYNFFHADMHPGNIFIDDKSPKNNPRYIAVDFGIMGTLSREDQHYLAENFLAFFRRDYRRVAELHVHSEWVPAHTRIEEFEGAIRSVCEPIFNRPIKEISFGLFLLNLFQTARRFDMEVQPQLVLLQKTLLNIEGLGRQLYPDLDLWTTAKPFLERWMKEQIGFSAFLHNMKNSVPQWLETLPLVPELSRAALSQIQHQHQQHKQTLKEIKALRQELRQGKQQKIRALLGGALLISGSLMLSMGNLYVYNLPLLGTVLSVAGATILVLNLLTN